MAAGNTSATEQFQNLARNHEVKAHEINALAPAELHQRCKEVWAAYTARYGKTTDVPGSPYTLLKNAAINGFSGPKAADINEVKKNLPSIESALDAMKVSDRKLGGPKEIGLFAVNGNIYISSAVFGKAGSLIKGMMEGHNQLEREFGLLLLLLSAIPRAFGKGTKQAETVQALRNAITKLEKDDPSFPKGVKVHNNLFGPVKITDAKGKDLSGEQLGKVLDGAKVILTKNGNQVTVSGVDRSGVFTAHANPSLHGSPSSGAQIASHAMPANGAMAPTNGAMVPSGGAAPLASSAPPSSPVSSGTPDDPAPSPRSVDSQDGLPSPFRANPPSLGRGVDHRSGPGIK